MSRLLPATTLVFALGAPAHVPMSLMIRSRRNLRKTLKPETPANASTPARPAITRRAAALIGLRPPPQGEAGHEMQLVRIAPVPE